MIIERIDLGGVNCYLMQEGESFMLIDTGGHIVMDKEFSNRRELLIQALEDKGCTPGNLKLIILTHGDNDHAANAAYLRDKYKTKIAMNSGDLALVKSPDINKLMESFKYKSIAFKIVFLIMKNLIKKVTVKILNDFEIFTPDFFIDDGCSLMEYGFNARTIHIPGHTEGSIGILTNEGNLIAGDTFTNIKKPDTSPNASDFKLLAKSVNRLRVMNLKTVYPGHGEPFDFSTMM